MSANVNFRRCHNQTVTVALCECSHAARIWTLAIDYEIPAPDFLHGDHRRGPDAPPGSRPRRSLGQRAAVRPAQLSEVGYASTLAREFNMLEPESHLKWAALRPNQAIFDFTQADRAVGFARVHGMKVRGHTLVWGLVEPALADQPAVHRETTLHTLARTHRRARTLALLHLVRPTRHWDGG